MSAFDLSERVAAITGGNAGIGLGIAQGLGEAGARVMICGRRDAANDAAIETLRSAGCDAHSIAIDVTDKDQLRTLFAHTRETLGPVDILVNNAGIFRGGDPEEFESSDWEAVLDTNLDSMFNVTHPVVGGMMERGFGRVVNISSLNGVKGQFGQANYSASKGGIHGFTMAVAQEVARKGVTVNTVSPGYLSTEMVMAVPEDVRNKIIAQIPVGRLGEAAEVAEAVAFLARDESGYITGMNFNINGGQHMQH